MRKSISKEKNQNRDFNKSLRMIAKSSVIVFIGLVLSKIFTYSYRIIIAREFGPEVYGLFILAVMISGWFIVFSTLGIGEGLIRYLPRFKEKNPDKLSFLFRSSTKYLTIFGVLSSLILFFSAESIAINFLNEPGLVIFLKWFSLVIPLTVLLTAFLSNLKAHEEIGLQSFLSSVLQPGLKVVLISTFLFLGFSINAVIFSYILALGVTLILAYFISIKKTPAVFKKNSLKSQSKFLLKREFFRFSLPLLFAGMMWRLFYWTDSLIIGFYNSATEVGIYNAAVPLAFLLSIASQLFLQLFFPLINKEYSLGNKETVKQLSKQLSKWTLALNLPILIILLVFPEFLINLLFGPEFLGATNALRILAIGGIFSSLAEFPNRLITSSGRSKIILIDITIITILNIFLNLFLVPKYGITGAATATMISFIVLSFTFTFQSIKYLSVFPIRRKMLNILLAAAVSTTGLIYFKSLSSQNILSFLLLATFFTTFYVLLIYLFRGLDKNDFMILRSATKFSKRLAKPPNK